MVYKAIRYEFGLSPTCILHIGANNGQEVAAYESMGAKGYHIEAIPSAFAALEKKCLEHPNQHPIHACLDDEVGKTVEFNISHGQAQASSLLDLGRVNVAYPSIEYADKIELETNTVDNLLAAGAIGNDVSFVVIDVQGAEHRVLAGAKELLKLPSIWGMVVEVSLDAFYEDGAVFHDLYTEFLQPNGFYLKTVDFNDAGWGNALFLKRWWWNNHNEMPPLMTFQNWPLVKTKGRNIARSGKCWLSSKSKFSKSSMDAVRAVQGYKTGRYSFHTDQQKNPWWKIDLGKKVKFDEVLIYNRLDSKSERATELTVQISDDGQDWTMLERPRGPFGGVDGEPLRITKPGTEARWMILRIPGTSSLHLDAVEIYDWDQNEITG